MYVAMICLLGEFVCAVCGFARSPNNEHARGGAMRATTHTVGPQATFAAPFVGFRFRAISSPSDRTSSFLDSGRSFPCSEVDDFPNIGRSAASLLLATQQRASGFEAMNERQEGCSRPPAQRRKNILDERDRASCFSRVIHGKRLRASASTKAST
jgi:hypothetical protein